MLCLYLTPLGQLTALPGPLAGFKGATSKGNRERAGEWEGWREEGRRWVRREERGWMRGDSGKRMGPKGWFMYPCSKIVKKYLLALNLSG